MVEHLSLEEPELREDLVRSVASGCLLIESYRLRVSKRALWRLERIGRLGRVFGPDGWTLILGQHDLICLRQRHSGRGFEQGLIGLVCEFAPALPALSELQAFKLRELRPQSARAASRFGVALIESDPRSRGRIAAGTETLCQIDFSDYATAKRRAEEAAAQWGGRDVTPLVDRLESEGVWSAWAEVCAFDPARVISVLQHLEGEAAHRAQRGAPP